MAILTQLPSTYLPTQAVILSVGLTLMYALYRGIYNRYFHPLRHLPGPFWASVSDFFKLWILHTKQAHTLGLRYHKKYGLVDKTDVYTTGVLGELAPPFQTVKHEEHAAKRKGVANSASPSASRASQTQGSSRDFQRTMELSVVRQEAVRELIRGASLYLEDRDSSAAMLTVIGVNGVPPRSEDRNRTSFHGDVHGPWYDAGLEIPTGSCTCVGFVGGTLSGGVGRYQGIHWLIVDNLISMQVVTAARELITVSAEKSSDMFWGMRGASKNFGVVVDFIFTKDQAESYFNTFASLSGTLPPELALLSYVDWNATYGGTTIVQCSQTDQHNGTEGSVALRCYRGDHLYRWYHGPEDKFLELVKSFTDLKPALSQFQTVPWKTYLTDLGFQLGIAVCEKGQQHSMYSVATKNLSVPDYITAFNTFDKLFNDYPETRGSTLEVELFPNQAVVAVPLESTAYPWRDVQAHVMIQMAFTGSLAGPAADASNSLARELRTAFAKTSGYQDLQIYTSYAHGDEDPVHGIARRSWRA
ncbi:hypothetical protein GJ744_002598 [Endocarpon pusillum]|uniref:FAD-binding PCMH-type domain-containing protein n=1 Tax=Endocarpon pusillum TaxID=364733 RepID=A0A8H7AA12_9EURO|nr:hypothetical protein GJ744_002598 [Endocarpon pusillum]